MLAKKEKSVSLETVTSCNIRRIIRRRHHTFRTFLSKLLCYFCFWSHFSGFSTVKLLSLFIIRDLSEDVYSNEEALIFSANEIIIIARFLLIENPVHTKARLYLQFKIQGYRSTIGSVLSVCITVSTGTNTSMLPYMMTDTKQ